MPEISCAKVAAGGPSAELELEEEVEEGKVVAVALPIRAGSCWRAPR